MTQVLLPYLRRSSVRLGALKTNGQRSSILIPRATGSSEPSAAVGTNRGRPSEQRQQAGWAQRIAERQSMELKRLDKISNRLQNQLLELDYMAGDEALTTRVHSNATACSSSTGRSKSGSRDRSRNSPTRRSRRRPFRPVPPSPEALVALIRRTESKRALLQQLDIRSPRAVARRLLSLSSLLALPADRLAAMAHKCGRLLLRRPDQLQAALTALADCLQAFMPPSTAAAPAVGNGGPSEGGPAVKTAVAGAGEKEKQRPGGGGSGSDGETGGDSARVDAEARAREIVAAAPELLLVSPQRLKRSGLGVGAVCKARGVKVLPMLSRRPDLLLQSAASLAAKMDLLPGLLGLPPKRLREVLASRPDLLRRSPRQLSRRYQLLGDLCGVPPDFLAELIAQEPGVLGFGADTLRAKFQALAGQYGRFQDDVADMILVDPAVLIKAPARPSLPPPATTAAGSTAAAAAAKVSGRRGKAPAATDVLPVLDQLLQLSMASGIAMDAVLRLVVQDERVCSFSRETVAAQLATLTAALGLQGEDEARFSVGKNPELLLLPAEQLTGRVEALTRLLQLTPGNGGSSGGGGKAEGGLAPAATLLQRHPELLLQDPASVYSRLAKLGRLLLGTAPQPQPAAAAGATGGPATELTTPPSQLPKPLSPLPPRLLALVTAQPSLLAAPPEETADKLLVMQSLFEIPQALVLELIWREPALLDVSADDLERKFRALAASFGAFGSDAIDVVFADPSLILTADTDPDSLPSTLQPSSSPSSIRQARRPYIKHAAPGAAEGDNSAYEGLKARLGGGGFGGGSGSSLSGSRGAEDSSSMASAEVAASERLRRQQQRAEVDLAGSSVRQQERDASELKSRRRALQPQLQDLAEEWMFAGGGGPLSANSGSGGGGGGGGGKGSEVMGLLGTMSAADFDKLGAEDLPPPPPPPSARRRRRLRPPEQPS